MKYITIAYIALGFVLSVTIGVEYYCAGQEMFPEYYGSPIIFKQKSLGSSLTYYYSIYGLIINTAIWSVALLIFRLVILKLIQRAGNSKFLKRIYTGAIGVLIALTTLNVVIDYIMLGRGFEKGQNYWYMNLDKEAKDWGIECKGKWGVFLFSK